MKILLLLIPVIGAITGWIITAIPLKLLFWPPFPAKIPFINRHFQGLVSQKQGELAAGIRELIETQLHCAATGEPGAAHDLLHKLTGTVIKAVEEHLDKKLPALIPRSIKQKIIGVVAEIIRKETPAFAGYLADSMRNGENCEIDFCRWAEDKIRNYDLSELATRISRSREIACLKTGAAAIGFISGLLQLMIVFLVFDGL